MYPASAKQLPAKLTELAECGLGLQVIACGSHCSLQPSMLQGLWQFFTPCVCSGMPSEAPSACACVVDQQHLGSNTKNDL